MKFLVFDVEADGLLDEATKVHCCSIWDEKGGVRSTTSYETMRKLFLTDDYYFVGHNVQQYDKSLLERILGVELDYTKFIDTLAISWAITPKRPLHGLESYGEEYNIPKVTVEDGQWVEGDIDLMIARCNRDVEINTKLFKQQLDILNELYEDKKTMWEFMRYVSFKSEQLYQQEYNHLVPINLSTVEKNLSMLQELKQAKLDILTKVMPKVEKKSKRNPPKKPFKKDGTLSSTGKDWLELTKKLGLPFEHKEPIEVVIDSVPPNPTSPKQQKDWLISLGWSPCTFKAGANGDVPQVLDDDKNLTASAKRLLDIEPDIIELENLGQLTHRIGLLKGFKESYKDGYIKSLSNGFTKTLRLRHKKPIANLPKVGKPNKETGERLFSDGFYIRGCIEAPEGCVVVGSDMSSLEDRMKQNFIYDLDPDYVKEMMTEDFDPHLSLAVFAGALTEEQATAHKKGEEDYSDIRHLYKTANYTLQFGAGVSKLAETIGKSKKEAKAIKDAYWKKNWAVLEVCKSARKKVIGEHTYLMNPINGYWYYLTAEKDIFSSWCQAGGAFLVDVWIKFMRDEGFIPSLSYHDEVLLVIPSSVDGEKIKKVLKDSVQKVNKAFKLKRDLDVDVQIGQTYASVH